MIPLFLSCPGCGHPAIKAAKQCRKAMELANARRTAEAEALLRTALGSLRQNKLPMMQAKILNSLGLVYAQQNNHQRARRCLTQSLRITARHVGMDNWLYRRIAGNLERLPG